MIGKRVGFFLIISWIIVLGVFGGLFYLDHQKGKALVFETPILLFLLGGVVLTIFQLFFPSILPALFKRYVTQQLHQHFGAETNNSDEEDSKWKEEVVQPATGLIGIKSDQYIKNTKFHQVILKFQNKQYQAVILDVTSMLQEPLVENEMSLRLLLDSCYEQINEISQINDRIANLEKLICLTDPSVPSRDVLLAKYILASLYLSIEEVERAANIATMLVEDVKLISADSEIMVLVNDLQGGVMLKQQHPFVALSCYQKALEYTSNHSFYEFKIASIYYFHLNDSKNALAFITNAFIHLDREVPFYKYLIFIYYRSAAFEKSFEEAYNLLENYLSQKPEEDSFWADQAYLAIKLNKMEQAQQLAQKVLSRMPKHDTALNVLGIINLKQGEYQIALNHFESILPMFTKETNKFSRYYTGEIYYHMGIAYVKLKNYAKAYESFQKAEEYGFDELNSTYWNEAAAFVNKNKTKK